MHILDGVELAMVTALREHMRQTGFLWRGHWPEEGRTAAQALGLAVMDELMYPEPAYTVADVDARVLALPVSHDTAHVFATGRLAVAYGQKLRAGHTEELQTAFHKVLGAMEAGHLRRIF